MLHPTSGLAVIGAALAFGPGHSFTLNQAAHAVAHEEQQAQPAAIVTSCQWRARPDRLGAALCFLQTTSQISPQDRACVRYYDMVAQIDQRLVVHPGPVVGTTPGPCSATAATGNTGDTSPGR